jgi:hypothetical protein
VNTASAIVVAPQTDSSRSKNVTVGALP